MAVAIELGRNTPAIGRSDSFRGYHIHTCRESEREREDGNQ